MKLPTELFLSNISSKMVYYFKSDKLNSTIPHYFVCLVVDNNEMVLLSCCTSQFEKRKKFIESRKLPHSIFGMDKTDKRRCFSKRNIRGL